MAGYASVVLIDPSLSHLDRAFTYRVPDGMRAERGLLVRIPFRGKRRIGVVVEALADADVERCLDIAELLGPGLDSEAVTLAAWVAGRYLSTLGEALSAAAPQRVVSEEKIERAPVRPDLGPREGGALRKYREGDRLLDAIERGSPGRFVWRPLAGEARATAIVEMVATSLSRGRGALVLVPEVRVSGDVRAALRAQFGDTLADLGADRSARARYRDWLSARAGEQRVVVGGRGAVFAPVANLGLIIVDDESHASYKEGRAPRYHARAVAAERARRAGATIVLVGVPPSVEARVAVERRQFVLVSAARAAETAERPPVVVVDVRELGSRLVPSAQTLRMAARELEADRRVVVVAHRAGDDLHAVASRAFRILKPRSSACLDARTPAGQLSRAIRSAECIVATPVVAKDLAPARVGLVAIVEADAALAQPEFRAAEEAFATWWRAARWIAGGGRLVIETADARQPAIVALTRWDPDVLFRAEAARRRELRYPPFAALARVDVPEDRAEAVAEELRAASEDLEVLGPVARGGHHVVVVRAQRRERLLDALAPTVARWRSEDEPMRIDIDPWEVLVPKWRSFPS